MVESTTDTVSSSIPAGRPRLPWVQKALCQVLDQSADEVPLPLWLEIEALQQEKIYGLGAELEFAGKPWSYVYVVRSGLLKLYQQPEKRRACVHHVFQQGDVIWPATTASRGGRNGLALAVVKPCQVARLPFGEFRQALRQAGYWEIFALHLELQLAEQALLREAWRQFMAPLERYEKVREAFGPLAVKLPDNLVAQWIGISPETLSRLKKLSSTAADSQ